MKLCLHFLLKKDRSYFFAVWCHQVAVVGSVLNQWGPDSGLGGSL